MSTFVLTEPELPMGIDDFEALEQRVLRTVGLLKAEREARADADLKTTELQRALEARNSDLLRAEEELAAFKKERDEVRGRVERLLRQLDAISA
jgi:chromosome segregation ATPase